MSHDRKPAKLRVVRGADAPPGRRRHDADAPPVVVDMRGKATAVAAAPPAGAGRGRMLSAALFVIGSAAGGVAVAVLGRT